MSSPGRHLALVSAIAAAVGMGGCVTVLPKATPAQLYRFGQPPAASNAQTHRVGASGADTGRGVVLGDVTLPRAAMGDGLLTVAGDQAAYIAGARWMAPAITLFREDAEAAFAARATHTVLLGSGQLAAAGALLSLDVTHFEARYPPGGGTPSVVVSVQATLASPDGTTAASRTFAVEQTADADRVSAIVAAYGRATDAVLAQVVDWTDATAPTLALGGPP